MRSVMIEKQVYNFNELQEEIKANLIEKEREQQIDLYCECFLKDEMEEEAKILLEKYFKGKAKLVKVLYNLNHCQGDGAMIEFDLSYYNTLVKVRQYGRYTHSRSFFVEDCDKCTTTKALDRKIIQLFEEFTKTGYKLTNSDNWTDRDITEILDEFEYLKDGQIYRD